MGTGRSSVCGECHAIREDENQAAQCRAFGEAVPNLSGKFFQTADVLDSYDYRKSSSCGRIESAALVIAGWCLYSDKGVDRHDRKLDIVDEKKEA